MSDSLYLHDYSPPGSTVHGDAPGKNLVWVAISFSRGSSQPRVRTQVSHIAGGFLPYEPPGEPKNTGVGSLSLLQGVFVTQKLNQCLLHCKQILYHLRNKGSLSAHYLVIKIYGWNLKHSEAKHIFLTFFIMLYVDLPRPVFWQTWVGYYKFKRYVVNVWEE